MTSDLRHAWRSLWRSPTVTIGAVLALALGIGATTSVFSLLNAVLLRPLPFPEADRLVEIHGTVAREQIERRGASYPDFFDWRARSRSFDGMASWQQSTAILYGAGEPEPVDGEIIDGPYFELTGAVPLAGRLMQSADHLPHAPAVAVIGERLWEQRFGRRADIVGRSLQVDTRLYEVVGVVGGSFLGRSDRSELFVNAQGALPAAVLAARGNRSFAVLARLRPGVALAAAQEEVDAISAELASTYPLTNDARGAEVVSLADEVFGRVRPAVGLLFVAVALVLLLAGANVASLLLGRSESRRREITLRRALGADDRRLMRLFLAESAWLVLLGGTAGWLLALWSADALLAISPVQLPSFAAPAQDWRLLLFVAGIGAGTTVAIGLTPMVGLDGGSLADGLREGAVEARSGTGSRTLRVLVVGEVAAAVTLMVVASLMIRSFTALLAFDPGFDPRQVLTVQVQLPLVVGQREPTADDAGIDALGLTSELGALPGVAAVSLASDIPLEPSSAIFFSTDAPSAADARTEPRAYVHRVTPGYFATLGMRVVDGRDFDRAELGLTSRSVIVSAALARRFWPGQSAIGHRIRRAGANDASAWFTIVGVVADATLRAIPRNPTSDPDIFFPYNDRARAFAVLLRTTGDPVGLAGPVRDLFRRHDPGAAVFSARTLSSHVEAELTTARFLSWLLGVLAAIALTLSIVGLYGLLSYWVRCRTQEIGIRAALGAGRGRLLGLVLGQAVGLTLAGIVAGGGLAAWALRLAESLVFGVQPLDSVSFLVTACIMLVAAGCAGLMPALRALRVNPQVALRGD